MIKRCSLGILEFSSKFIKYHVLINQYQCDTCEKFNFKLVLSIT